MNEEVKLSVVLERLASHLDAPDLCKKLLRPMMNGVKKLHVSRSDVKYDMIWGEQQYGYETHARAGWASIGPRFVAWEQKRDDGYAPSRMITTAYIFVSKRNLAYEYSSESSEMIAWETATPNELEEFMLRVMGSRVAPPK